MTVPQRCPACGYRVSAGLLVCPSCQGEIPSDLPASVLISFVPGMETGGQEAPSSPTKPQDPTPMIALPTSSGPGWNGPFGIPPVPSGQAIATATEVRAVDLIFDTGQVLRVSGPGLLGRNPQSADPSVTCTNVHDPDRSVSKTHLDVGIDERGFWVKDRGSTNGSALIDESGQVHKLEVGVIVHAKLGSIVAIGRRRFRVEEVR